MKAWKLDHLGGTLQFLDIPIPAVRAGSVLVRVEAQSLMSYLKPYIEGKLAAYRAPKDFTPGGNAIGRIEIVGDDVWHLKKGDRVVVSPHIVSKEVVQEPGQILLGITSPGSVGDDIQKSWRDGTLAEYVLVPAGAVTLIANPSGYEAAQLAIVTRCVVPYGGLLRGRLQAGETIVISGATGAYGTAATLVALAMGASRVVVAGRNRQALNDLSEAGGERVISVALSGDVARDSATLREAAGGGAHVAFDMVGGAKDANSTLAALGSLYRWGRMVLMGSSIVPIPIDYMQVMFNNLEIIGNFMYPAAAYLPLLELVRSGQLDLSPIKPRTFPLSELVTAMDYAAHAGSSEIVVVMADRT